MIPRPTMTQVGKAVGVLMFYAIGMLCIFLLASLVLGVTGYLVQAEKTEFLIHPLAVLVGLLFLYKINQGAMAAIERSHTKIMEKLEVIERLQQDSNLQELRELREKLRKGKADE